MSNRHDVLPTIRFLFLDGLRGIAAMAVIIFHCYNILSLHLAISLPWYIDSLFFAGHFGVQIFFVLSGFVIAYSTRNAEFNLSFLKNFILKRSIRLDPPYWMAVFGLIFLSVLGSVLFHKENLYFHTFNEVWANIFYLQYILELPSILPVAWTLCIELQLYVALMLLLVFCNRMNKKQVLSTSLFQSTIFLSSLGLLTIFCLLCHFNVFNPFGGFQQNALFIFFWHQFFLGTLVCWTIYKDVSEKLFIAVLLIMGLFLIFNFNSEDLAAMATSLVIFIVAKKRKMNTLLISPFLQWNGKISYSLYITHWLTGIKFIDVFKERIMPGKIYLPEAFALCLAALLIIYGFAYLFYKYVEEPSLHFSRKWENKRNCQKNGLVA